MGSKPNVVVYVTRAGLAIAGKKMPSARMPLPPDLVSNLEVMNVEQLTEQYQRFFESHSLKGKRVLVVLGISVMFDKLLALDKHGNPGELTQAFVSAMPFNAGLRACLTINTGKQLQIYATNASMYAPLAEALRQVRAKVVAITPAQAYHLESGDKSFDSLAAQFMKDAKVSRIANFQDATVY